MLLPLHQLVSRVHDAYRSKSALRDKWRVVDETVFNQHTIELPQGVLGRAEAVHVSAGFIRLARAVAAFADPNGARVKVTTNGITEMAADRKTRAEAFFQALLNHFEQAVTDRESGDGLRWDMLGKSVGFVRVMPDFAAWAKAPGGETFVLDDDVLADADTFTTHVREMLTDLDRTAKAQQRHRETHLPIQMEYVPARNCIPFRDRYGLSEMVEVHVMPVLQVLGSFLDNDGRPLARGLAAQFGYYGRFTDGSFLDGTAGSYSLTDEDVCTVAIRTDREHMQICVTDIIPDDEPGGMFTRRATAGVEELIWQGAHRMECVPYEFFEGRVTPSRDDVLHYNGYLDPAIYVLRALDNAESQEATLVRTTAWPTLVVERTELGVAMGDRPLSIPIAEGEVYNGLQVGETIKPLVWSTPEQHNLIAQYINRLKEHIDELTAGRASFGQPAGPSGYLYAQQLSQEDEPLNPWERGFNRGYAGMLRLAQRAAQVLFAAGMGSIPVRYVGPEGARYVTFDEELAQYEWDITVTVRAKPLGGEFALTQTLDAQVSKGWETDEGAMERLGKPYPQKIIEQRMVEQLTRDPDIVGTLKDAIKAAISAGIAAQLPQNVPSQLALDPALASVLQQKAQTNPLLAALAARTMGGDASPGGASGVGSAGAPGSPLPAGVPGQPNLLTAGNMAPPAPHPLTGQSGHGPPGGGLGGNPTGQALALPGGIGRSGA